MSFNPRAQLGMPGIIHRGYYPTPPHGIPIMPMRMQPPPMMHHVSFIVSFLCLYKWCIVYSNSKITIFGNQEFYEFSKLCQYSNLHTMVFRQDNYFDNYLIIEM